MAGLGQAMEELSRISIAVSKSHNARLHTHWCMLERKRHNILDSFKRHRLRVSGEALAQHNLDSTELVGRAPIVLVQQLLSKGGKSESLEITILRKVCPLARAFLDKHPGCGLPKPCAIICGHMLFLSKDADLTH